MNPKKRFAKQLAVLLLSLLGLANVHAAVNINYVVNNHLGAPVLLVDENQHVVWEAEYDEFGKATILVEEVEFNVRFPGQYYDKETGLTYNYYRDYDERLGRYVQSDPIGILKNYNDPQMQMAMLMGVPVNQGISELGGLNHVYSYVEGNPVMYYDPYGLRINLGSIMKAFEDAEPGCSIIFGCPNIYIWKCVEWKCLETPSACPLNGQPIPEILGGGNFFTTDQSGNDNCICSKKILADIKRP